MSYLDLHFPSSFQVVECAHLCACKCAPTNVSRKVADDFVLSLLFLM